MEKKKNTQTALKVYLEKSPFICTPSLHTTDRSFIIQTDTLKSNVITKLVSLGVHTFTSINNRGLQHILIEY